MKSSYKPDDVILLFKDLTNEMKPLSTEEREHLIQSGQKHYSEMLPLEQEPTQEYMNTFKNSLILFAPKVAEAIQHLCDLLYIRHAGKPFVLISLARAGTPIGILIKRYMFARYNLNLPHYSISIIRDKGIDKNAMQYIYDKHKDIGVEHFQFIDGWVGKGTISRVLKEACAELNWDGLSSELAVLSDPTYTTLLCGTREDLLIPSACLNSTVSGLVSRTILNDKIGPSDFHGAVYFEEFEGIDHTYYFIDEIVDCFNFPTPFIQQIQEDFSIKDTNLIKPGIGETTRVLLRRVPWKVLINPNADKKGIEHILLLCKEKNIPISLYPLRNYSTCGIIKPLSDSEV